MKATEKPTGATQAEIELIHRKTLDLLEYAGIWVMSEKTRDIFKKHGFRVDGETVYYTGRQVEDAIKTCPSEFRIRARNSKHDLLINKENVYYYPGSTCAFIRDFDGTIRTSSSDDVKNLFKLCQMIPEINCTSELVTSSADIDPADTRLYNSLLALKMTDKVNTFSTAEPIELVALLYGKSKEQMREESHKGVTYMLSNISPKSPMTMIPSHGELVITASEYGQPLIITPMAMAGLTAPCTLPGVIVQTNAEILATLVLSQLVNPGNPLFYAVISTIVNMKKLLPLGCCPETSIINRVGVQMADYYGLPTRADTSTLSNTMGFQAGAESAFSLVNSVRSGGNLIKGLGSFSGTNAGSFEKLVLDADLVSYMNRLLRPLEFTEETMAVDLIKRVAPHGNFLGEDHTLDHYMEEFCVPDVFLIESLQDWQAKGSRDVLEPAHRKVNELIDNYVRPDMDRSVEKDLEKFCEEHYHSRR